MNRLTKDQRDRLILVVLFMGMAIAGVYFALISSQLTSLKESRKKTAEAQAKVDAAAKLVQQADSIKEKLEIKQAKLKQIQDDMASGDLYSWIILTVNKFQKPYKVGIVNYSREKVDEVQMLPEFPFKSASFTVDGSGYYHDVGKFVADFENNFPYIRLQNFALSPMQSTNLVASEKLDLRMEIVALIAEPVASP